MYINIGSGNVMDTGKIIGIFDLDITSQSYITRNYLKRAETCGQVFNAADDIPKAYLVCSENSENLVYLCQPASSTLSKRAENDRAGLSG